MPLQEQHHAVGLAIHVQHPSWHTALMKERRVRRAAARMAAAQTGCNTNEPGAPGRCTASSTDEDVDADASYEDVLLDVLERHGYVHELYSAGWGLRPVLVLAFEFGWLKRLAARTRVPLVQVLR